MCMMSKTALKAFMLVLNIIFFICGGIVMGIGIWAVADKIYISDIIGNSAFSSAAILMVICGVFMVLVSFLGCAGAIANKRVVVAIYVAFMIVIFILLMATAIVAAVFQGDIADEMKLRMRNGLMTQYGYSIDYNTDNRRLTNAWDLMQTRLRCCAVDDNGWNLYQQSYWFTSQYNEWNKKFVPPSCCVYEGKLRQYRNLQNCQSFEYGPPKFFTGGVPYNDALHYAGCYTAAKDFVTKQSSVILGIGFSFCVFLIAGIVVGIAFIMKLNEGGSADFRG